MKFELFIKQKKESWYRLSELTDSYKNHGRVSGRELSEMVRLYRAACADYAYAKFNFPQERVTDELHLLVGKCHNVIYRHQPFNWKKPLDFLAYDFPDLVRVNFRFISMAFLFFMAGASLSFVGSLINPELPSLVLGERYVNVTTSNIEKNDPFAIYKQEGSPLMSSFIMTNNIKVTFFAYGMGLLAGVGTVYVLFYNGMMLGVFFFLFFKHGLFLESFFTIMLHGTIELFCIFIAGGAGLLIGKALVFPGQLPRRQALQKNGLTSIQLLVGTAPLLVIAGIIEGFITRLDIPFEWKVICVLAIFSSLLAYFTLAGRSR